MNLWPLYLYTVQTLWMVIRGLPGRGVCVLLLLIIIAEVSRYWRQLLVYQLRTCARQSCDRWADNFDHRTHPATHPLTIVLFCTHCVWHFPSLSGSFMYLLGSSPTSLLSFLIVLASSLSLSLCFLLAILLSLYSFRFPLLFPLFFLWLPPLSFLFSYWLFFCLFYRP